MSTWMIARGACCMSDIVPEPWGTRQAGRWTWAGAGDTLSSIG
jgi:hypothetical protein